MLEYMVDFFRHFPIDPPPISAESDPRQLETVCLKQLYCQRIGEPKLKGQGLSLARLEGRRVRDPRQLE